MADESYLSWPFFEARHRARAAGLRDWGAGLAVDHADTDAACRALVAALGEGGWLQATAVDPAAGGTPPGLQLLPAHPNPFNGRTQLEFVIPVAGPVRLGVYDLRGRLVGKNRPGPRNDRGRGHRGEKILPHLVSSLRYERQFFCAGTRRNWSEPC